MPTIRGRSQIDFGDAPGDTHVSLVVAAPDVKADSDITARVLRKATDDHSEDEASVEHIDVTGGDIVAGESFTLHAVARAGRVVGAFHVGWEFEK
jgi:hypothetical protein